MAERKAAWAWRITVQPWGSFCGLISPPPPLLPFSFLGCEIPEVAAQLERTSRASSWYSGLQSRSTKVGSLEFGDCCGERWLFLFSFRGLDPFAPRRLLPHLKRMKSSRRCSFPERGPRLTVTAALITWRVWHPRALRQKGRRW